MDPRSRTRATEYTYNGRGLQETVIYEETGTVSMFYDAVGNLTERWDEEGVKVEYEYDDNNRLIQQNKLTDTTDIETYSYDGLGRLKTAKRGTDANDDSISASTFIYDPLSRLTSECQSILEGTCKTVSYDYGVAGNRTQIVYHDTAITLDIDFDGRNRAVEIQKDSAVLAEYVWLGSGIHTRTITTDYEALVCQTSDVVTIETSFARDGLMRVWSARNWLTHEDQAPFGDVGTFTYEYDDASNVTDETQNNNPGGTLYFKADREYDYDRLNRLTDADVTDSQDWTAPATSATTYAYDELGNRTSHSYRGATSIDYDHDKANRMLKRGTLEQEYDDAGNLTKAFSTDGSEAYQLHYDHHNRLTAVYDSTDTYRRAGFRYDALGRRIEFVDDVRGKTIRYYYDGVNEISEYDENGDALRSYVHGAGYVDERIAMVNHEFEATFYYAIDRMFNVRTLIDNTGAMIERYAYDAYGRPLIRELAGRGDMNGDGHITGGGDVSRLSAAYSCTIWDPRGDMDGDGENGYDELFEIWEPKAYFWQAEPTVAQAFSDVGNPFMFQGRPHFAMDTAEFLDDGLSGDLFGFVNAISGDLAVVGVPFNDENGTDAGIAYVYGRSGSSWLPIKKLSASDGAAGDTFGFSVSINGDTIVIGASGDDDNGSYSGSAYVYYRNSGGADNWGQVVKLAASDAAADDNFGYSVSIDGDTIVVGASGEDTGATNAGAGYVFERDSGGSDNWGEVAKLTAQSPSASDNLGSSIAIDGDTVVAGAPGNDTGASNAGGVFVFVRPGGGWSNMNEDAILYASDAASGDSFGNYSAVDISGDVVVVGAFFGDATYTNQGSAYVFVKPGGGWSNMTETGKLTASDPATEDRFGLPVAIDGDWIVAGSGLDDDNGSGSGSIYLYEKPGTGWTNMTAQTVKRVASDGGFNDFFSKVAIDGDTITCGAIRDDDSATDAGASYFFEKDEGGSENWGETAKVTAAVPSGNIEGNYMLNEHRARFHDPAIGRWLTRDPLGYDGGSYNVYEILSSSPPKFFDPDGYQFIRVRAEQTPDDAGIKAWRQCVDMCKQGERNCLGKDKDGNEVCDNRTFPPDKCIRCRKKCIENCSQEELIPGIILKDKWVKSYGGTKPRRPMEDAWHDTDCGDLPTGDDGVAPDFQIVLVRHIGKEEDGTRPGIGL